MTTQLDRLEALAEKRKTTHSTDRMEVLEWELANALPDLIRVARAAKEAEENQLRLDGQVAIHNSLKAFRKAIQEIRQSPLYREVENDG